MLLKLPNSCKAHYLYITFQIRYFYLRFLYLQLESIVVQTTETEKGGTVVRLQTQGKKLSRLI